jgi:hypothetical protein
MNNEPGLWAAKASRLLSISLPGTDELPGGMAQGKPEALQIDAGMPNGLHP